MEFKILDQYCTKCGRQLTTWDSRCRQATGTKDILCEECIATMYGKDPEGFRELMKEYFDMRPCQGYSPRGRQ